MPGIRTTWEPASAAVIYRGEIIEAFFSAAWKTCGGLHLVPTSANGQPAFAIYEFSGTANAGMRTPFTYSGLSTI
jgi:hypothetical protein